MPLKIIDANGDEQYIDTEYLGTVSQPAQIVGKNSDAILAALGATNDAAAGTDTATASQIGLFKRLLQQVTALIALLPANIGQKAKTGSLAVTVASDDDLQGKIGALTETAPASDTASSGLNGRLQRIAQNIATLISKIPTALGQQNAAGSLSVVVASNQAVEAAPFVTKNKSATASAVTRTSAAITATTLLASNSSRLSAIIFNDSTANLYLKYGTGPSSTSKTVTVQPGDTAVVNDNYTGVITGVWASATGAADVTELT